MHLYLLITAILCSLLNSEAAKILGIFYVPSKSHHILGSTLLKALAERGHEVTMLSPFPLKNTFKNYEDIDLTGMLQFKEEINMIQILQQRNISLIEKSLVGMATIEKIHDFFFAHEAVNKLTTSNKTFDVVIFPYFGNDAFLVIPHLLGAYTILYSTIGSSPLLNRITGNSAPYSYVPNFMPAFPDEMNLLQRLGNTLSIITLDLIVHFYASPLEEQRIKKHYPHAPSVQELISNISLVLLNSHYSIESPRPYVPNIIPVGGLQIQDTKELQGDLKRFMDSSTEGVILLSLGSNVQSSQLPKETLDAIVKTFAKLPLKVVWKFETDNIPNLPKNVKVEKWLPQGAILGHPNTKLFITHGGLLSTTEAIYHGVPMVGIPFFGDQDGNVNDGVNKGYMAKLDFLDLTEESLSAAIKEVLENSRYREVVKTKSAILKDQPLRPLDSAVYWVEYVIRHKGAFHLQTTAVKLEWYQYYLVDVISLIIVLIFIVLLVVYLILGRILCYLKRTCSRKSRTLKEKLN